MNKLPIKPQLSFVLESGPCARFPFAWYQVNGAGVQATANTKTIAAASTAEYSGSAANVAVTWKHGSDTIVPSSPSAGQTLIHSLEVTDNSGNVKLFVGNNPVPQTATSHGNIVSEINYALATTALDAANYGTYYVYAYATDQIRLSKQFYDVSEETNSSTAANLDEDVDYVGAYTVKTMILMGTFEVKADGTIDTTSQHSTGASGTLFYSLAADESNVETDGNRGSIYIVIDTADNLNGTQHD